MTIEQLLDYLADFTLTNKYGYRLSIYYNKDNQTWVVEIPGLCKIEEPTLRTSLHWAAENAKLKTEEPVVQYRK